MAGKILIHDSNVRAERFKAPALPIELISYSNTSLYSLDQGKSLVPSIGIEPISPPDPARQHLNRLDHESLISNSNSQFAP